VIALNIDVPQADMETMRQTFARYVAWFRKGPEEAVKKTCVYVVRSLRADTNLSAKHRRVVRNPNYINVKSRRAQNKRLRQLAHIKAWYESRGQSAPTDTAEYFNRYAIERLTQRQGARYTPVFGAGSIAEAKRIAQASMSHQYMIKRRGLAKASWGWMLGKLGKQTSTEQAQISGATEVSSGTTGGAFETYFVDLVNKLAYIRKASKASISSVIGRAQRAMVDEMEGHIKRAREQAGLRAT
jgi:hypothetical protein